MNFHSVSQIVWFLKVGGPQLPCEQHRGFPLYQLHLHRSYPELFAGRQPAFHGNTDMPTSNINSAKYKFLVTIFYSIT